MAEYLAQRIIDGIFDNSKEGMTGYQYVINKRSDLKIGIDMYLTEQGRTDLIAS